MKFFILSLFILSAFAELNFEVKQVNFTVKSSKIKTSLKISGGSSARDKQFPFVAEISIKVPNGQLLCTGSLISREWIVSARHCIADTNAQSVDVFLGASDRQSSLRAHFQAETFVWLNSPDGNHPDISLLKLASQAPINDRIQPIRLPKLSQENKNFNGLKARAVGWGGVGGGRFSRYLKFADFVVQSSEVCFLGSTLMCSQGGRSSLEGGDSGGPLIFDENGTSTLIGVNVVVVTGRNFKVQGSTRVSSFLRFIRETTGIPYR